MASPVDGDTLKAILTQAKIANRLLVIQIRQSVPQNEIIGLLMSTGASDREIAEVLDTTVGTVSTTKGRIRKQASKGRRNEEPKGGSMPEAVAGEK